MTESGVARATGCDRDEWFALLDEWGAAGRPYGEIAGWLTETHGLTTWWAQKLIVEYEQARGVREPGARPDGTFTVTASRTIDVAVEQLVQAVVDAQMREKWLPGEVMRERTSGAGRARFDWDGTTRVAFSFDAKGEAKSGIALEHEHLPDAATASERKAWWRERLTALKTLLES